MKQRTKYEITTVLKWVELLLLILATTGSIYGAIAEGSIYFAGTIGAAIAVICLAIHLFKESGKPKVFDDEPKNNYK